MKVERETVVQTEGFNLGRSAQMTVDENSLAHIMSVLTNLYSDRELAVIREYSTNAYDSMVEAGKGDEGIHVRLPSALNPVFVVQDFGVGLSEEEVFEIYGSYGASTKRESNDFVGQLGLGCKSALTLSNQFTMTAIKDGQKNVFSIHLDEYGIGAITKVHGSLTDEGNGVTVSVPVENVTDFRRKAQNFYRFFPVRPYFVGEEDFDVSLPHVLDIEDNMYLVSARDTQHDIVVMGGVPYPIERTELLGRKSNGYGYYNSGFGNTRLVIEAKIGDVNFTPSREALHYTKKTELFIKSAGEKVTEVLVDRLKTQIAKYKTFAEAYENASKNDFAQILKSFGVPLDKVLYKGVQIFRPRFAKSAWEYTHVRDEMHKSSTISLPTPGTMNSYVVVVGTTEQLTSTYKKKLKIWMGENKYQEALYFQNDINDYIPEFVFDGMKVITKDDLKKIKLPTAGGGKTGNKKAKMYRRLVLPSPTYTTKFESVVPDKTRKIVYAKQNTLKGTRRKLEEVFYSTNSDLYDDTVDFFVITANQATNFLKAYPNAQRVEDFVRETYTKYLDGLSKEVRRTIAFSGRFSFNRYLRLPDHPMPEDVSEVGDDELTRWVELIRTAKEYSGDSRGHTAIPTTYLRIRDLAALLRIHMNDSANIEAWRQEIEDEAEKLYNRLVRRYPLIFNVYGNRADSKHVLSYLKAVN